MIEAWQPDRELGLHIGSTKFPFSSRTNYIRGVYTVGVSVEVLWKFVEYQIQECDYKSSEWWAAHITTGKGGLPRSSWQYKKITGTRKMGYLSSVCSYHQL